MFTWLTNQWDRLRDSLWFIPSLFIAAALTLSVTLLWIEYSLPPKFYDQISWIRVTASNAQTILSVLVGALVTVIGLVFSLTIVSLSQTASQYGPRLMRSVVDSTQMQTTLGMFVGSALFSLIVMRSITSPDEGIAFIPHISILVSQVISIACVCLLVNFTSYIGRCLRAEDLISRIAHDLDCSASHIYPDGILKGHAKWLHESNVTFQDDFVEAIVHSTRHGYLQAVGLLELYQFAEHHNLVLDLTVRPGQFISEGQCLVKVCHAGDKPVRVDFDPSQLESKFILGTSRTPRQDIECAVHELVEMAVRALSPGINDPITAMNVVDSLGASFAKLAQKPWPANFVANPQGELRMRILNTTFERIIDSAYNMLRQHGAESVALNCRLLESLTTIAHHVDDRRRMEVLKQHGERIVAVAERTVADLSDLEDIRERAKSLRMVAAKIT